MNAISNWNYGSIIIYIYSFQAEQARINNPQLPPILDEVQSTPEVQYYVNFPKDFLFLVLFVSSAFYWNLSLHFPNFSQWEFAWITLHVGI